MFPGGLGARTLQDTLRLGTAGISCSWALPGYSAVADFRDTCWALGGHFAVGHCRDTLRLGTAGIYGD